MPDTWYCWGESATKGGSSSVAASPCDCLWPRAPQVLAATRAPPADTAAPPHLHSRRRGGLAGRARLRGGAGLGHEARSLGFGAAAPLFAPNPDPGRAARQALGRGAKREPNRAPAGRRGGAAGRRGEGFRAGRSSDRAAGVSQHPSGQPRPPRRAAAAGKRAASAGACGRAGAAVGARAAADKEGSEPMASRATPAKPPPPPSARLQHGHAGQQQRPAGELQTRGGVLGEERHSSEDGKGVRRGTLRTHHAAGDHARGGGLDGDGNEGGARWQS